MMDVNEKDWKLFRKKAPEWQRRRIEELNASYMALLSSSLSAEEKFWKLRNRIIKDSNNPCVDMDMRRSSMHQNLIALLTRNIISLDDLEGFSDDLVNTMRAVLASYYQTYDEAINDD